MMQIFQMIDTIMQINRTLANKNSSSGGAGSNQRREVE